MTLYSIIFYLLGLIILVSTALAITRKNPVHAIVYVVVSFFATALLFYLLGAPLLAALEVIVYAGAIMVLFLFIIMTANVKKDLDPGLNIRQWIFPLVLSAVTLVIGVVLIVSAPGSSTGLKTAMASPSAFGHFLFKKYWLSVEIISLLLFVSLVGAFFLGKKADETTNQNDSDHLSNPQPEKTEDIL
jgi:NADH-quinone oxidoreductase subunit J